MFTDSQILNLSIRNVVFVSEFAHNDIIWCFLDSSILHRVFHIMQVSAFYEPST